MTHNIFISYDLNSPGQNYEKVIERIKSLGNWAKVQKSMWYLRTNHSHELIAKKVWEVMDSNDSLIVINTSTNNASWYNLDSEVSKFMQDKWYSLAVA
jgi:hypothetical protein